MHLVVLFALRGDMLLSDYCTVLADSKRFSVSFWTKVATSQSGGHVISIIIYANTLL